MENSYIRDLTRVTRYVIEINNQGKFEVHYSLSLDSLLIQLWDNNTNVMLIEEQIINLNKITPDFLTEKVNDLCVNLDRYRNK